MARISDAARKARNEYQRQWRARNPERVREINNRYWDKKSELLKQGRSGDGTTNEDNR